MFKGISRRYVKAIRKLVGSKIHEVWCFNPQIYVDLRDFHAEKTILLIYDFYRGDHVLEAADSADAIVSVSQLILDHYRSAISPKLLLQHGLGRYFTNRALSRMEDREFPVVKGNTIRVGYVGNLLRVGMNTAVARQIIDGHPDIEFHFWGPCSMEDNNVNTTSVGLPEEIFSFIGFLKERKNVSLHGVKEQESLAAGLSDMDAFLFLYSPRTEVNGASNSHKLLEYLSTGKAVISTHVSNYAGTDLLIMSGQDGEDELPETFNDVISNLEIYNAPEKQRQRIAFALDNTYARQVDRIQEFISPKALINP